MHSTKSTKPTPNPVACPARKNPFAVQRTDAIEFCFSGSAFANLEQFAAYVAESNFAGAIRGRRGRGKTTLLCDLHGWLDQQGINNRLIFFSRDRQQQQAQFIQANMAANKRAVLLIDGVERLHFLARQRLLIRARLHGRIIATTHAISLLPTLIHCRSSRQSLDFVLNALGTNQPEIAESANRLLTRHKGNIRLVLRALYDQHVEERS